MFTLQNRRALSLEFKKLPGAVLPCIAKGNEWKMQNVLGLQMDPHVAWDLKYKTLNKRGKSLVFTAQDIAAATL